MKLTIDDEARTLRVHRSGGDEVVDLYSARAFSLLAHQYIRVGWNQKYSYRFVWMGRPIIQLPDDIVRMQEVIHATRPDLIIETGVAHGGSLIFYASLFEAMGEGDVLGIDIAISPENRAAIESHPMAKRIRLIEGSSTAADIVTQAEEIAKSAKRVMVILDSDHSYAHVSEELSAYAPLVSVGCCIVATDGVMRDLADVPRGRRDWADDNPARAAEDFATRHPEFVLETPPPQFNESAVSEAITYFPSAWLKRT